jgi:dUTP pyrophosphatase
MQEVFFKKIYDDVNIPDFQSENAVGVDLESYEDVKIKAGEIKIVGTGLQIKMPNNLEFQIRPRSGMACKYGITVINSPGTIDPDYTGEIGVGLVNRSGKTFEIKKGDRIAQGVFNEVPLVTIKETSIIEDTERGSGGFGSTGK